MGGKERGSVSLEIEQRTRRVHEAADDETAHGAAGKVQRGAFLHSEMLDQPTLGEEVGGQLYRASHTSPDHGGADAAVESTDALAPVDLAHAVEEVLVLVLGADGEEGREALEAGLDEEEGAAGGGANDAGRGAAQHVDAEALDLFVAKDEFRQGGAHGLVEAETAAVEEDLVNVGGAETAVNAAEALVLDDDGDAVEGTAVKVGVVSLALELALQLHSTRLRFLG